MLDLPDVSRNRSLFDFLNAIASISPGFSDAWMMRVQEKQDAGETLPDLYVGANPSGALLLYNNAQHIFLFINKVSLFHFSNKIVSNG